MSSINAPGFEGWYFEDGYLCTPEGDRFTPLVIKACHFFRQMKEVKEIMYWRPDDVRCDVQMPALIPSSVSEADRPSITAAG